MSTIVTRAGKGSALTWTEADSNITNLNTDKMEKSAPVLAGNLDVATYSITTTTANGNITIEPNGTGDLHVITDALRIGDLNAEARISTYGTGNLVLTTNEGNDPDPSITIANGANAGISLVATGTGNITLTPVTGKIILGALDFPTGTGSNGQVLTTNGSTGMSWTTVSGGSSTLDGLTDVVITTPATGAVLQYNGTNWVDEPASTLNVNAAATATTATNITISTTTGNSNDTTLYPVMVGTNSASSQAPHIDSTGLAFNATTNTLTLGSSGASNAGGLILFGASTSNNITIATPSLSGSITLTLPSATGTLLNSNGTLTGVFNGSTVTASSSITPNNTGGANINFGTSGLSASAWTNLGISIRQQARTYTDSSSTGTVAVSAINGFGIPTLGSTNAITVTDAASIYIADGPTAGTNTTITNKWALLTAGNIKAAGATIGGTTLPTATGTTGQVLALSSAGVAAWTTSSGSAPSITDDIASATTHYLIIDDATSGALGPKTSSTKLTFVPSTGVLTATGFAGALTGNASTATTATNATNVAITGSVSTNASFFLPFVAANSTSNQALNTQANITYNPSSLTLSLPNLQSNTHIINGWDSPFTSTGFGLRPANGTGGTFTDTTTAAGTVAADYFHAFAAPTRASTNAITVTDLVNLYVAQPATGTNTTATNRYAILSNGTIKANEFKETVFAIGNSGTSTLTPDAANGNIQTITATGNFTLSAFSNPTTGETITFIITQDATGSRTLTSTMKFAGGSKTLSTAANSIDILTVSYIGTTYYASLAKAFA